jgi:probable phosphoglycerate mutase
MSQSAEKFYFVRHGQTDANLNNLAAGSGWDIELNDAGLAQAKALAESASIENCRDVKTICVSPMARAIQTAEAINKILQAPIVIIDELKEWFLGDWERGSWSDLPSLYAPDTHPPNGESQLAFGMRVKAGLTAALAHPGPIIIVAHGGVWHAVSRILSLPKSSIDNCDLRRVSRSGSDQPWSLE